PVKVVDEHAVFGGVGAVAHHLEGAEVRGHERQAGDPTRDRAPREEEILAGFHPPAKGEADSQHEHEIDGDNRVVNKMRMHSLPPIGAFLSHGIPKVNVRLRAVVSSYERSAAILAA